MKYRTEDVMYLFAKSLAARTPLFAPVAYPGSIITAIQHEILSMGPRLLIVAEPEDETSKRRTA